MKAFKPQIQEADSRSDATEISSFINDSTAWRQDELIGDKPPVLK
jgi:hypothetical protein